MEEHFDVLTEAGLPVGRTAPRSEVHALGLWHRAFHLFLVGEVDGVPCALMQVRALDKDTQPGRLDVAVGGHFRAGESLCEVLREAEEEIGLRVEASALTYLWTQRSERVSIHRRTGAREFEYVAWRPSDAALRHGPTYVDREHQDVYLLRRDLPPSAYRPDPVELAGLVAVSLDALLGLLEGRATSLTGRGLLRARDAVVAESPSSGFVSGTRDFSFEDLVDGDAPHLLRATRAALSVF